MNNYYGIEIQALKVHVISIFWLKIGNRNFVEHNIFKLQNTSEERK